MTERMAEAGRYIGERVRRVEDPPLLTGSARYLDDIKLPGMVHAAFVRSPHAHARIGRVEVGAALRSPGVLMALAGTDVSRQTKPIPSRFDAPGYRPTRWPPLAVGKVRFVGEPVAVVVGPDRYRAEDAADLFAVDYEPLPPVTDAEAGMKPDAPRLHEELPDNILLRVHYDNGQVERAFGEAEVHLAETFRHPRCTGAAIENRGVIAHYDRATGKLTVWSSTQIPHLLRTGLAQVLDFPESRLHVVVPSVGGGFGIKMHLFPEEIITALLALRLGCPVKWVEDRREDLMASIHAREHLHRVEVAAKKDGTILGLRARIVCDVGAYSVYPVTAALDPLTAAGILPGPYRIRGYAYDAYAVATNKCPAGAYRGVGMAVGTFVRERLVDMLARKTGLDPAEIRRRNFVRPGDFPYTSASGLVFDSGSYAESLEKLLTVAGYAELRKAQREDRGPRSLGIGICCYNEFTGMGSAVFRRRGMAHVPGYDSATVKIEPSGQVRAFVSAASQGQGHATVMAQILAEELGVKLRDATVEGGDTDTCPYGTGTFASRTVVASGGALSLAARRVRDKVLRIAAHHLAAPVEDLVIEGGEIWVRGASEKISLKEVAAAAYFPATGALPAGLEPGLEATHTYDLPGATFSNGAHLAVVEVDRETGQVEILRYIVIEDCGRMVNPILVEGQVHGAVAQGIGNALYEDLVYDESGQPLTTTFMDYLLPTALEVPSMEIAHLETPSPISVGGVKGMAEGGTIGGTATVANAVADALAHLGIEVTELPLSPEKVYRLLRQGGARVKREVLKREA